MIQRGGNGSGGGDGHARAGGGDGDGHARTGSGDGGSALAPRRRVGFFTDTTVCIGCKACEVACKQWNQLPDDGFVFTGLSYDNTAHLGSASWRHVSFVERQKPLEYQQSGIGDFSWLFHSDVCKHCERAGCLENCPTGAIIRTELGSVYVQPDVCNGCGYCVVGCPFGVIDRRDDDGRAFKCTLCYDRLKLDMEPACAKACPTDSIQFGELDALADKARARVAELHADGVESAYLYGVGDSPGANGVPGVDGTHAFFLLVDEPEVYNLPPDPVIPQKKQADAWRMVAVGAAAMAAMALGTVLSARRR